MNKLRNCPILKRLGEVGTAYPPVIEVLWEESSICTICRRLVALSYRIQCTLRDQDCVAGLAECQEVCRDRPFPIMGCRHAMAAWPIYIDNLSLWEICPQPEAGRFETSEAPAMALADRCHSVWNSPGSPEDRVDRALTARTLGVVNDGVAGRRRPPADCFGELRFMFLRIATAE